MIVSVNFHQMYRFAHLVTELPTCFLCHCGTSVLCLRRCRDAALRARTQQNNALCLRRRMDAALRIRTPININTTAASATSLHQPIATIARDGRREVHLDGNTFFSSERVRLHKAHALHSVDTMDRMHLPSQRPCRPWIPDLDRVLENEARLAAIDQSRPLQRRVRVRTRYPE